MLETAPNLNYYKTSMALGRPSIYSDALCKEICRRISLGESLRSVCRDPEMPNISTALDWAFTDGHPFSRHYATSREVQAESLADEMQEIADDSTNDYVVRLGKEVLNPEAVQRSRLRIDTRKWIASKMKPKRFGDKIFNEHSGSVTLESLITDSIDKKEV